MKEDGLQCCRLEFWAFALISLSLVLCAGITSGLALGLLSFSQVDLEVLLKAGQPHNRHNASKILPLVKNEHLLLCTLLIAKSLAMEALPVFLDSILPTWGAIIISVILVVGFVEIIPQAVCSRHGLSIGAKSSLVVRFLLLVFYPFSYPISKLLDWLLGKGHSVLLRRAELKTLVDLHANEAGKGGDLSHHETSIITGALELTQKTAKDAMTPISETFSLNINCKLDMHTMGLIISKGHSRVPIHSGNPKNVIGLILAKNLIFCRPEDETPIKYMTIRSIPRVHEDWPLYDILTQFQKGHSHMAVVVKHKKEVNNTANNAVGRPSLGFISPYDQPENSSISTYSFPFYSSDTEFRSPTLQTVIEQDDDMHPQYEKRKQRDRTFYYEEIESPPGNLDEEAVGIITMEDVLEELLQKDILDETDEYVDIHNKIRINLPPSRSSPRSPKRVPDPQVHWRAPDPSPLSSYNPILRSPITPDFQPPLIRPTLYDSPGKSMRNHPGCAGKVESSP